MDDSKLTRSEFMQRDNKFTDVQKGYFKQLIADCLIKRFTTEEGLLYLKDKLGVQIEEDEFHYLKIELKRDVKRNVQYLRRYEYAYIREYLDRIEEMRLIQNKLWKLAEGTDNPILQKDCLSELSKSTIALADFYRSINELEQRNVASSAMSSENTSTPVPEKKASEISIEESDTLDEDSLESKPTPVPEKKASEISIEESVTLDENSLESKPTPVPEKKASEISIEDSVTLDENSLESKPTPVPEVETSQYTVKKIVRYTSDGKLAPLTN
jgi:hypothetical protein